MDNFYSLDPPGRFLTNDPKKGTKKNPSYMIVQKSVTIQKTRQAFRDAKVKKMSFKNLPKVPAPVRNSNLPIAPEKSEAAKNKLLDDLQKENTELKRRLAKMEREMKSMIAMNKLAYPKDISSESSESRDTEDKDPFNFDIDLDMFLETEKNMQALRKEASSNVRSYEKVVMSSESNEPPFEESTKSSKSSILGKFGFYIQKVRYSVAMRVFGARTVTDIKKENTRMELRLKTMQLVKKYMIKKHVDRVNGKLKQ